jgi:hypothetical protein
MLDYIVLCIASLAAGFVYYCLKQSPPQTRRITKRPTALNAEHAKVFKVKSRPFKLAR